MCVRSIHLMAENVKVRKHYISRDRKTNGREGRMKRGKEEEALTAHLNFIDYQVDLVDPFYFFAIPVSV